MAVLNKRAVVSAIEMFGRSSIRLPQVLGDSFSTIIRNLFANNEQGFVYDPNDLTTLFQDAAGTVPVTGVGQPVGLILDKSKGLTLDSDLVTNGDFSNGVFGWSSYAASTITNVNATLEVNITGGGGGFTNSTALNTIIGSWYRIDLDIKAGTYSGKLDFHTETTVGVKTAIQLFPNFTRYTIYFRADSTNTKFSFTRTDVLTGTVYVDNIVVRRLFGNHARQTTSASRPVLRQNAITGAYYLEFDGVDDFLETASFPSMGLATTIFTGTYCSKGTLSALVSRAVSGYVRQSARLVGIQSSNNPIVLSQSGSTVITVKYAVSGAGVTLKVNDVSNTNPATTERGFDTTMPLIIGAFNNGGQIPYQGYIYSLIGVSRIATDDESIIIEREIAKRTGVTLSV